MSRGQMWTILDQGLSTFVCLLCGLHTSLWYLLLGTGKRPTSSTTYVGVAGASWDMHRISPHLTCAKEVAALQMTTAHMLVAMKFLVFCTTSHCRLTRLKSKRAPHLDLV